jgi:hypothetical protein
MNQPTETRVLTLGEKILFREANKMPGAALKKGLVTMTDPDTGRVIFAKKANLILRRGRELTLRKIFGIPYPSSDEVILNATKILLFGIGTGGTPAGDPFNPTAPTPPDAELSTRVPFRLTSASNPLPTVDIPKYVDDVTDGGTGLTAWYKKAFTAQEIVMDDVSDDYYVKLTLDITKEDARDALINELALYSATYSAGNYSSYRIFSRITFPTEPLPSTTNKALTVEYYIYA